MNAQIKYTHIVDQSEKTSAFAGTAEALQAGIERLSATQIEDGDYIYFASESGLYYVVSESELIELGAGTIEDADIYSIWCARNGREAQVEEINEIA